MLSFWLVSPQYVDQRDSLAARENSHQRATYMYCGRWHVQISDHHVCFDRRDAYEWSVLAAGRHQMPFATQSALQGGNLRVGLEDSIYIGRGELAKSSAQQVSKIKGVIENLDLTVARPAEARSRLGLKGADQVGF